MNGALKRIFGRIGEALFPNRCSCCMQVIPAGLPLCDGCKNDIQTLLIEDALAEDYSQKLAGAFFRTYDFDRLLVNFCYDRSIKRGLQNLKFKTNPVAASFFADRIFEKFGKVIADENPDFICFVPLSEKSKSARGYDQTERIAKRLSELCGVPVEQVLAKICDTPTQHSRALLYRFGNVFGVYDVTRDVTDKTVLLLDDIVTTGATLHECAKMLKLYNAKRVVAIAVASPSLKPKDNTQDK